MPVAALFEAPTIAALSARVRAGGGRNASPLVPIRPGSDERLFLVHPAGGSSLCYRGLAGAWPLDGAVWGFEAPGRLPGETAFTDIPAMATAYGAAMRAVGPGPYRIVGWSFGGLVAVEIARQLHAAGETVAFVGVIDTMPSSEATGTGQRAAMMEAFASETGLELPVDWGSRDDAAQLRWVVASAAAADLVPEGYSIADAERQFAMQMAHQAAAAGYVPAELPVPLLVLAATDETADRADALRQAWQRIARSGLRVEAVPGRHASVLDMPDAVAAAMAREWR